MVPTPPLAMLPIGISVLIPVFNHDVRSLVTSLQEQLGRSGIDWEIIVAEDGSDHAFQERNSGIAELNAVSHLRSTSNIGRAAIRNKLANEARFSHLLFIDADSALPDDTFIQHYLMYWQDYDAVLGGTAYNVEPPDASQRLRWLYGKRREQVLADLRNRNANTVGLALNNVLIKRTVFLDSPLDESMITYGHEDTRLGMALQAKGVTMHHIQNPVIHTGLESGPVFLEKTKEAVANFYRLSVVEGLAQDTKLYKAFIKARPMAWLLLPVWKILGPICRSNLLCKRPMLSLFDLYKLMLMLELDAKHRPR